MPSSPGIKGYRVEVVGFTWPLVRGHATRSAYSSNVQCVVAKHKNVASTLRPVERRRAVLHLARVLAYRECVRTVELGALSKLVQAAFAGLLVLLGVHAEIVLRKASSRVRVIERAVAAIKNIDFRVVQCRVAMRILFAIL